MSEITKIMEEFMTELEKDYSDENSDKSLLVPQNNREYWLFTEIWQRCNDLKDKIGMV